MAKEDDELEFATKEDLEAIQKSPELQKAYNAMKAGVTKKFQSFSAKNKELEDAYADADDRLSQWENWYSAAFPQGWEAEDQPSRGRSRQPNRQREDDDTRTRRGSQRDTEISYNELLQSINDFQNQIMTAAKEYDKRLSSMGRMLDLSLQLNDLYRSHPELDGKKVLQTALEKNYNTLDDAYNFAYKDEILNKEVEKRLTPKLEEELKKKETERLESAGPTLTHFSLEKEAPKSFGEARNQVLEEISKGTLNK